MWGTAEFPAHGLWNVHGKFKTDGRYANGMTMSIISGDFSQRHQVLSAAKGWIFVTRDVDGYRPTDPSGKPQTRASRWWRAIPRFWTA
jgi:hypothetical protein